MVGGKSNITFNKSKGANQHQAAKVWKVLCVTIIGHVNKGQG